MTATSSAKVWDLNDSSAHRQHQRRRLDLGSPIAAALGVVSIVAGMTPDVSVVARWCMVLSFGGIGVLIACSSLRRRQARVSLLIGLLGVLLPIAAVALAVEATGAVPDAVVSQVAADADLNTSSPSLSSTPAFDALAPKERIADTDFAIALVARIAGLHGSGPYPSALSLSSGVVVEASGPYSGVSLGALPDDARLVYSVSRSGTLISVTLVSSRRTGATVTATNTGVLPQAAG